MMNTIEGFPKVFEKNNSIKKFLAQYDFMHALTAVFAITSWRKNRGAQESCLALNMALAETGEWGNKKITTFEDLLQLYQDLYPFLKTTRRDDSILPDFGEIKLNYQSKYYSVITGTGHTVSVFAALQFLEKLSESVHMNGQTTKLLEYSDYYVNFLKNKNASIDADFMMDPCFECPTFDYFIRVQDFLSEAKWNELGSCVLSMLDAKNNEIIRSHFFHHEEAYYPLFNPSLIIDYQTQILNTVPESTLHSICLSALKEKLLTIYNIGSIENGCHTMQKIRLLNGRYPVLNGKDGFSYLNNDHLVIFLECNDGGISSQELENIKAVHENGCLSVVNLEDKQSSGACKAYRIHQSCKLSVELISEMPSSMEGDDEDE